MVVTAKTISLQKDGQDAMRVDYKLDPKKQPKAIDTTHEIDPGKPILQMGSYSLEKDRLTLCIAAKGVDRPRRFKTDKGNTFVLRRSAPTAK